MYSAKCFLEVSNGVSGNNRIRQGVPVAYDSIAELSYFRRKHTCLCSSMFPMTQSLSCNYRSIYMHVSLMLPFSIV